MVVVAGVTGVVQPFAAPGQGLAFAMAQGQKAGACRLLSGIGQRALELWAVDNVTISRREVQLIASDAVRGKQGRRAGDDDVFGYI